jgi:hypothetical protein
MMVKLSAQRRRFILRVLDDVANGTRVSDEDLALCGAYLSPGRPVRKAPLGKTRKEEREEKRVAHAMATSDLYTEVMARANGRCESCRLPTLNLVLDHWEGGAGRRRERQNIRNCWALCAVGASSCNSRRTANYPSAEFWNVRFAEFCARHGYSPTTHIEKQRRASL